MSKVIKKVDDRYLAHIVQTDDGKLHFVDTTFIDAYPQRGYYELMSFPFDGGKVTDWLDECYVVYETAKASKAGHYNVIEELEVLL